MTLKERRIFLSIASLVTIQGIVYFIFKEFFQKQTDFGLRPHDFTSSLLHMHILFVPALVFLFGYLYKVHIYKKLKSKKKKISGFISMAFFVLMIFSGYLLQMGFSLDSSRFIGYLHVLISVIWFAFCIYHAGFRRP